MILEKWDDEAKEIIKGFSYKERERFNAIIAMHIMVGGINDERAYTTWRYVMPDKATEWDFIDFAKNDEGTTKNALFNEAVELFKKLWNNYAAEKNGLYIGGKLY